MKKAHKMRSAARKKLAKCQEASRAIAQGFRKARALPGLVQADVGHQDSEERQRRELSASWSSALGALRSANADFKGYVQLQSDADASIGSAASEFEQEHKDEEQ